ncbi:hypothetical protein [Kushneria aurantia]|uniref:Uncharacterized protein n=1 Tax=Kushneria aurantia TaxID=504092 RepID=A0ABV6G029_9GAMM|nr:hypothetical protein [Kushneria aurantia]
MIDLTAQEIARLKSRDIHPLRLEGGDCLIEMHGRRILCSHHDLHRLAAPSLRERLRGQVNRLSRAT